jgi:dynein heavy chain
MHVVCQLPMITDLRNPNLRARHLDKIEQVLKYKFTEEDPMTLGKLEEMDAFEHNEEIQEVSSQASSEAGLETILKKVYGHLF